MIEGHPAYRSLSAQVLANPSSELHEGTDVTREQLKAVGIRPYDEKVKCNSPIMTFLTPNDQCLTMALTSVGLRRMLRHGTHIVQCTR